MLLSFLSSVDFNIRFPHLLLFYCRPHFPFFSLSNEILQISQLPRKRINAIHVNVIKQEKGFYLIEIFHNTWPPTNDFAR